MNNPILRRRASKNAAEAKSAADTKKAKQPAKDAAKKKAKVEAKPKVIIKRLVKPIVLKPRVSEKTYAGAEQLNSYVFEVPKNVNKHDVGYAITAQYEVTVKNVRLANVTGKPKRSYRRGGRYSFNSQRSNIRKAYVTLAEGDKLPIFSAIEESAVADKENK